MHHAASDDGEVEESLRATVRRWCALAAERGRSPLFLASREGDAKAVRVMLCCPQDMLKDESEDRFMRKYMSDSLIERVNRRESTLVNNYSL